jgi:hypothetical protein
MWSVCRRRAVRNVAVAAAAGLSGVIGYRDAVVSTTAASPLERTARELQPPVPVASGHKAPTSPVEPLDSVEALDVLGRGRAVILIARGYSAADASRAQRAFHDAATKLTAAAL